MIMIWPQYIDRNLTTNEGRKISKEYAVNEPTVNEIAKALKKLKIKYSIQKEKSYPGKWYEKSGRVLAESEMKKNDLLREVSLKIKDLRN